MELKDLEEEVSFNMTIKCVQKLGLDLALSLRFTVFAMRKFVGFKKISFILLSLIYVFTICNGNYC